MHSTYTKIVAANIFVVIVQHPRATDNGWSTLSNTTKCANTCGVRYSNEHYSTYGRQHPPLTTNNSFTRTSVQRAPTAIITLFPLMNTTTCTALYWEQCTSLLCHTSPLRRAVGFIYVSTRNTIIGGNICILVSPVSPFSPCDASRDFTLPTSRRGTLYLYM